MPAFRALAVMAVWVVLAARVVMVQQVDLPKALAMVGRAVMAVLPGVAVLAGKVARLVLQDWMVLAAPVETVEMVVLMVASVALAVRVVMAA